MNEPVILVRCRGCRRWLPRGTVRRGACAGCFYRAIDGQLRAGADWHARTYQADRAEPEVFTLPVAEVTQ